MASRSTIGAMLALLIPVLSGCVTEPGAKALPDAGAPAVSLHDENSPQPGTATYSCADGGMMTIQNLGTSLRLLGPNGVTEELPASPAGQTSRYGRAHDAIVLDGNEALVMTGGHPPMPCTR